MGYGKEGVQQLGDWIGKLIPWGGSILELGSQDINRNVPLETIRAVLQKVHGDVKLCDDVLSRHFEERAAWKIADLFRYSKFRYTAIDLYPGDFIVQADLNTYQVPEGHRGQMDLVTNNGTSEHVTDQVNVFRLIHDYLKPGGFAYHAVPFTGYFNHGLYNYHPLFFLFLAHANRYKVVTLNLSAPHLQHNIPTSKWLSGSNRWQDVLLTSGMVACVLQKVYDAPFALFTDYDRTAIAGELRPELEEALKGRYDLCVRVSHQAPQSGQYTGWRGRISAGWRRLTNAMDRAR